MIGSAMAVGWDDRETARYYEAFCRCHARYRRANRELVGHAELRPGLRVLDLAAGTGRTAEATLPFLGRSGRIVCVEPAAAMREAGRARLGADRQVDWRSEWPRDRERFDRVLCGAAIWQLSSFEAAVGRIRALLAPGGLFVFNIPSLYLGEPDEPGKGSDPLLQELPARISVRATIEPTPVAPGWRTDGAELERIMGRTGFTVTRWRFRLRFTQRALRDWMKIPVLTDYRLGEFTPRQRAAVIDAAFAEVDATSWKWERWTGWTAEKVSRSRSVKGT